MQTTPHAIRQYRLAAHHLDKKLPLQGLAEAAGACGLQNSPPGAWETAAFNRVCCTLPQLHDALYEQKTLLQAWSIRGVPLVFPAAASGVFLAPLAALPGEEPWIYTRGVTAGLDFVGLSFSEALALVRAALPYLDENTVKSKEALDAALAAVAAQGLPPQRRALWNAPSMYGAPDKQTVGGAIVSFLLRPCSFEGRVVFGRREGAGPTFTSLRRWTGAPPRPANQARLARSFVHCYGPTTPAAFAAWLGSSPQQTRRLWQAILPELLAAECGGKTGWVLAADAEALRLAEGCSTGLRLLGAHDAYLDLHSAADRALLAPAAVHRQIWKTVANPGAVLENGRISGVWKQKLAAGKLELTVTCWQAPDEAQRQTLARLAEEYAAFRGCALKKLVIQPE